MQIGYTCMGKRLSVTSKQLAIVFGLLAVPATFRFENISAKPTAVPPTPAIVTIAAVSRPDPRAIRLKKFLNTLHCPVSSMADDFIHAADDNHIDWRLLPSISVIESSGGKAYRNNNIFGWANGDYLFPTVRSGIHQVAFKLGKSTLYRNLDTARKLHYYNPNPEYPGNVIAVMNRISPAA